MESMLLYVSPHSWASTALAAANQQVLSMLAL